MVTAEVKVKLEVALVALVSITFGPEYATNVVAFIRPPMKRSPFPGFKVKLPGPVNWSLVRVREVGDNVTAALV